MTGGACEQIQHPAIIVLAVRAHPDFLYVLCGDGIYSHNVLCKVLQSIQASVLPTIKGTNIGQ